LCGGIDAFTPSTTRGQGGELDRARPRASVSNARTRTSRPRARAGCSAARRRVPLVPSREYEELRGWASPIRARTTCSRTHGCSSRSRRRNSRVVWASLSVYGDASCSRAAKTPRRRRPFALRSHQRSARRTSRRQPAGAASRPFLRYFTVYGTRQRPDMAMRRLCEALIRRCLVSPAVRPDGSQCGTSARRRASRHPSRGVADPAGRVIQTSAAPRGPRLPRSSRSRVARRAAPPARPARRPRVTADVRRNGAEVASTRSLGWRPR
jgi:hypothetical protein